jgi:two-component system, cell cycle sensor histidine kinase and response regulator CckA
MESGVFASIAADDSHDSGERFSALVQNGPYAVAIVNENACITYVSPSMAGLSGYAPEELVGRVGFDFVAPDDLASATDHFARALATPGHTETFEVQGIHKEGRVLWLEVALTNMLDDQHVQGVACYFHEITRRIADQELLAETEEKYRRLVEDVPAIVYVSELGEEGAWHYVSPQVEAMLGISNEEWMDNPRAWLEAIHPDDRQRVMDEEASARHMEIGGTIASEYRVVPRNGHQIWVRDEYRLLTSPQETPCLVRGVIMDISARKHLEEQLRQSQKMDAIGQLAGGIAHDFNNLLLIVQNSARFIAEDLDDTDPKKEDVDEIIKAGERAGALIRQLLTFSRKEVVNHEDIRVNEVVSDVERLLRRTIGENINLELRLDPEAGHVTIDRTQLEQVIVNLAVNAKDAMPGGGRLQIKTKLENFAEVSARHPGIGKGRYVGLSVIDTGEGMSPDVQDRAFEPFFTTKARGEGTGLGLATVFGVVQAAGGVLEIDSSPGSGTAVTAFFPRKENGYSSAKGVKAVQNGRHGRGQTILVVEDEEAVRRLVQRILDRNGYEVLVAQSGKMALELVAAHDGEVDLLLTDVVMPHMSGKELASRFGEAGYKFPTLFMSGYTDQIMTRDGRLSGDEDLILKPFDSGSLLSKIGQTLSSR